MKLTDPRSGVTVSTENEASVAGLLALGYQEVQPAKVQPAKPQAKPAPNKK